MAKKKYIKLLDDTARIFLDEIIKMDYKSISKCYERILDHQNYIIMLTTSDSDCDELTEVLKYSFSIIDDLVNKYIDCTDEKKAIFDIGRLYGTMQLSSRICYEKKKDHQVYETALSVCGIKHFDDIISLLYSRKELTQTELCEVLDMKPSALSECMKKIINTNMVVSRRSGKYKVYALSDDGLRFAKMRLKEKNHEKELTSANNEQYQNSISDVEFDKVKSVLDERNEVIKKIIKNASWLNNYLNCTDCCPDYVEFANSDFDNILEIEGV